MNLLERIAMQLDNPRNYTQLARNASHGNRSGEQGVLVSVNDLEELIKQNRGLEARLRADSHYRDGELNVHNRTSLTQEVHSAFHNLGVEETLDIVTYTISELRKCEQKDKRRLEYLNHPIKRPRKGLVNVEYKRS